MTRSSPDGADTASEAAGLAGEAVGHAEVLRHMREQVLRLLEEIPRQPRSLRIRAGDVAVDVEWEATHHGGAGVNGVAADGAPVAVPEPPSRPADGAYVLAPTVGVFYRAPEPGADPFVAEGDTVTPGQQVAIVEAMKMMIPVEADQAGRITEALKENGDPVEYQERLFALEPEPEPGPGPEREGAA